MILRDGHVCIRGGQAGAPDHVRSYTALLRGVLFAASEEAARGRELDAAIEDARHASYSLLWASPTHFSALHLGVEGAALHPCLFPVGDFSLHIGKGTPVSFDDERDEYIVDSTKGTVSFGNGDPSQHVKLTEPVRISAASQSSAGRISFSAAISASQTDASLRYFYLYGSEQKIAGFTYPVFKGQNAQRLPVKVEHDPVHPGDETHNRILITAGLSLPSTFLSVAGEPLNLDVIPNESGFTRQWDPVAQAYYSVPMGNWGLSSRASKAVDLMCGLSGLEFARLPEKSTLTFVPGAPCFTRRFPTRPGATGPVFTKTYIEGAPDVTTSWIYIAGVNVSQIAAAPPAYFSQPVSSGLFQTGATGNYLETLDLQSAAFPSGVPPPYDAPAPSFPMAPYLGTSPKSAEEAGLYRSFEIEMLSPVRSNAIFKMNWPSSSPASSSGNITQDGPRSFAAIARDGLADASHVRSVSGELSFSEPTSATGHAAITPQGLYSVFSDDYSVWQRLILAVTGSESQTLELQNLADQLRAAMLTSQLFLVISNRDALKKVSTVAFSALDISGWRFDLNIDDWRPDTVLILKFAEKSLKDLVSDPSMWSAADGDLNNGAATQLKLEEWIKEAENHRGQPEFDYFLNTVMEDWNGVIFANVAVPPGDFPTDLQALGAGIDTKNLKAHHFGVNLSPMQVRGGVIRVTDSALFGLIYYEDSLDLVYSSAPYDFKVLSLRVLFSNSEIASFSSRIELLVGELFAQRSTLQNSTHGDNLILKGVMQRHEDEQSFSFNEEGVNDFAIESLVLNNVVVNKAQFVSLPQAAGSKSITARFVMAGRMSFLEQEEFDMLSFGPPKANPAGPGGLQFSNMFVSMTYQPASSGPTGITGPSGPTGPTVQPEKRQFSFQSGQMSFDLSQSPARPQSLYARFPLQVTGMVQGDSATTPAGLGFIPVDTPLSSSAFGSAWFGLQMALSLGSQGGLAAKAGFSASMLAAWAPGKREYNALLGLQLPGSQGGSKSLTIEGPLKLTIQDIAMLYNKTDQGYLMRFANIALTLFSLRFPPGGTTNLLLFGDPDPKAPQTTLGWYAAYMKNPEKKDKGNGGSAKSAKRAPVTLEATNETKGCGCGGSKSAEAEDSGRETTT